MTTQNKPRILVWSIVAACLAIQALQFGYVVHRESLTFDEANHMFAGYMMWKTRDFGLNPEHPPLVKLLATAPLLHEDLWVPPLEGREFKREAYLGGRDWLARNDGSSQRLVFRMRLCAGLLALALSVTVFLAAREWFGAGGGNGRARASHLRSQHPCALRAGDYRRWGLSLLPRGGVHVLSLRHAPRTRTTAAGRRCRRIVARDQALGDSARPHAHPARRMGDRTRAKRRTQHRARKIRRSPRRHRRSQLSSALVLLRFPIRCAAGAAGVEPGARRVLRAARPGEWRRGARSQSRSSPAGVLPDGAG